MRRNVFAGVVALILLTCLAYFPVLNGGAGFIWDDDGHVTNNAALHDTAGLASIWTWGPRAVFDHSVKPATQQYYPATFTSFWLEYQAWGNNPLGYHITNVVLHILAALLLWLILRRLGLSAGVSFLAAALFAVHPVNVESVAWISERKNTLSIVFYLLAGLCWIRWAGLDGPPSHASVTAAPAKGPSGAWLVGSTVLFVLALMAKSVTATLPAGLLLLVWWKRGRIRGRDVAGLLPLVVVAGFSAWLTTYIETSTRFIGAIGSDFDISFPARCIIAGRAVLFYAEKLFAPLHLMFFYPRWAIDPGVWAEWLYPAAVVAAIVILAAWRKRIGRGPLVLALLFIVGTAPALGFIDFFPMQFSFVADHFQYLGMLAGCTAAALLFGWAAKRIHVPAVTIAGAGVLLAVPAVLTFQQTHIYSDELTLYRKTLAANPDAWIASDNLAALLTRKSDDPASQSEALALCKRTLQSHFSNLKALISLGDTLLHLGQNADAQKAFEQALAAMPLTALSPDSATDATIEDGLGTALLMQGKFKEAADHYEIAADRQPEDAEYRAAQGTALLQSGNAADAERQFRRAIDLKTGDTPRYEFLLGQALHQEGRLSAALAELHVAIEADPNRPEPFLEIAEILVFLHKDAMAIDYYESALHLKKDDVVAQVELARLLLITDDESRRDPLWAADLLRQAVEETHGAQVSLKVEYASALAAAKFYDQAIDILQGIVSADPKPALSPEDRETLLTQIQRYQMLNAPPIETSGSPPIPPDFVDTTPAGIPQPLPAAITPRYIPPP